MTNPKAIWLGVGGSARQGVANELRSVLDLSDQPWQARVREEVGKVDPNDDLIVSWKLWLDLRLALSTYAYARCADAEPTRTDVPRYGEGPGLLVARDAESAAMQVGNLAFQFSASKLHALELTVAEPARGPGGYQWVLSLRDGDQIDVSAVDLPIDYAPETTYEVLLATLHLASFLGVPMHYKKVMDV